MVAATASTSSATSTSSSGFISKGKVDVGDLLLSVGSLEVYNLFFLLFLALLFVFLLVDGGLLPLGVDLGPLSGLPHVKLWSLFLSLLGFPFIKGQSLGLVAYRLLFLNLFFIFSGFRILWSFLNRGVICLITLSLNIILEVSPISLSASTALLFGLDASPGVSTLTVKLSFASTASSDSGPSASTSSSGSSTPASTTASHSSTAFSVIIPSYVIVAVSLVVALFSWSISWFPSIEHFLSIETIVPLIVFFICIILVVCLDRSLGSRLGCRFDLLGLGCKLLLVTLLEDIQRISFFIKKQSVTICDTYSVGILHFEHLV